MVDLVVKWSLFVVRMMVPVAVVQLLPGPAVSLARSRDRYQSGIPSAMKPWGALVNISGIGELLRSHARYAQLARHFTHVAEVLSGRPGVGFPLIAETLPNCASNLLAQSSFSKSLTASLKSGRHSLPFLSLRRGIDA